MKGYCLIVFCLLFFDSIAQVNQNRSEIGLSYNSIIWNENKNPLPAHGQFLIHSFGVLYSEKFSENWQWTVDFSFNYWTDRYANFTVICSEALKECEGLPPGRKYGISAIGTEGMVDYSVLHFKRYSFLLGSGLGVWKFLPDKDLFYEATVEFFPYDMRIITLYYTKISGKIRIQLTDRWAIQTGVFYRSFIDPKIDKMNSMPFVFFGSLSFIL